MMFSLKQNSAIIAIIFGKFARGRSNMKQYHQIITVSLVALIMLAGWSFGETRLYLGDPPGPITKGQMFAVPVYMDSDGFSLVVADLVVSFPPESMSILGMDSADSVFVNPNFDNPLVVAVDSVGGSAEIVSGIPTPGASGEGVLVGFMICLAKDVPGDAEINLTFTSAGTAGECHLVLDDGQGTDVLEAVLGQTITINDAEMSEILFAHFVEGLGYETTVTLINALAADTASGVFAVRDADGIPRPISLNEKRHKGFAAFEVGPQQAVQWTTSGEGDLFAGTGMVSTNKALGGVILFDSPDGTAGVGASMPATSIIAPVERFVDSGVNSGVAFFNPFNQSRDFDLVLRSPEGESVQEASFSISPFGQIVGFIDGFFPEYDTTAFRGSITYDESFPMAAMVIRTGVDSGGSFATMPAVNAGEIQLYFAQFADGEGIRSAIILMNPSSTVTVQGTVTLTDEDGAPLSVDINGGVVAGEFNFTLLPYGVSVYETDGVGELSAGNVRVTSDNPVGGTILFFGADGTAGVGDSRPQSRVLVPVEKVDAAGVNTGLSVINLEATEIEIQFQLLGLDGILLAESELVRIPSGGQYVRYITDIFPTYLFPEGFYGLVKLDVPFQFAAMAIRTGPQSYATLPVVPME